MAEDTKTGQGQNGNSGEGQGKQQAEMVPKADLEKLQNDFNGFKQEAEKRSKQFDEQREELLSPDYLAFKEQQQSGKTQQKQTKPEGNFDLEDMSRKELVDLIKNDIVGVLEEFRRQHLDPMKKGLVNLIANEEVRRATAKYDDFDTYRPDIQKLIQQNNALSIDEAYHQAKGLKEYQKTQQQKEAEAKANREKPGGPSGSAQPREFKSSAEAAEDAWSQSAGNKDTL